MTLRRLIREMLLTEAAYTPERAASEGLRFMARRTKWGKGGWEVACIRDGDMFPAGEIRISIPLGMGNCLGAHEVTLSEVSIDGIGPLLYDIALELAGPAGLMSDRRMVSTHARKVWQYYQDRRPDVDHKQMDSQPGTLTPDIEEDDCNQTSASYGGADWRESPLSKVYRKNGTPVIDRLKALGIIEIIAEKPRQLRVLTKL